MGAEMGKGLGFETGPLDSWWRGGLLNCCKNTKAIVPNIWWRLFNVPHDMPQSRLGWESCQEFSTAEIATALLRHPRLSNYRPICSNGYAYSFARKLFDCRGASRSGRRHVHILPSRRRLKTSAASASHARPSVGPCLPTNPQYDDTAVWHDATFCQRSDTPHRAVSLSETLHRSAQFHSRRAVVPQYLGLCIGRLRGIAIDVSESFSSFNWTAGMSRYWGLTVNGCRHSENSRLDTRQLLLVDHELTYGSALYACTIRASVPQGVMPVTMLGKKLTLPK